MAHFLKKKNTSGFRSSPWRARPDDGVGLFHPNARLQDHRAPSLQCRSRDQRLRHSSSQGGSQVK